MLAKMAMLGEGLECPHNPEVVGLNPAPATRTFKPRPGKTGGAFSLTTK